MIERIARRAGGFASTTALRWLGAAGEIVPDSLPGHQDSNGRGPRGRLAAGAAVGAVALLSSEKVRAAAEQRLRAAARTIRPDGPAPKRSSNGNGDLAQKTRAELYELAKKMKVAGRSAMSKEELTKALSG